MEAAARVEADECRLEAVDEEPLCPRCGTEMIWMKASWHCLACRYKEGCCG